MADDLHTDGNGAAGVLARILAVEATQIERTCHSCGGRGAVGALRAYRGAGLVLRCESCGDVAIRVVEDGDRLSVEWRGVFRVAVASAGPVA